MERLTFEQAVQNARDTGRAAFAAAPVFGDDEETAEGLRIFIVEGDGRGACRIRFVAGPFFSAALAANEVIAEEDVPPRVRELQFMPTAFSEEWLSDQVQVLVARLAQAAQVEAPEMPDYFGMPRRKSAPEVVFPVSRIGRAQKKP
jgi:hypothetical protein